MSGLIGVISEMREYAQKYPTGVGASVLLDWAERLERDLAARLEAQLPALHADIAAIEESKKVRRSLLDKEIDL